jgi:long-subunit fatty acid transport protein
MFGYRASPWTLNERPGVGACVRRLGRIASGAVLLGGVAVLLASPAAAAGFWLYEMGTPDLGTASAGRAALAKDAATVFGNPAGMTSLDRSQLLVGTQLVVGDVHFDRGSGTTVAGGNGGNAAGTVPGGSLYYAHSVTPDVRLGFWSGSYFGSAVQYEDGWSGRYYGTKAELITLGAGINGAYKINDWLSIGGGPFALYGKLDQRVPLNNVLDGLPDGSLKFSDDEFGVGGMADGWLWSVGGGYDSSPMSKNERSPNLPLDQQFRLGTGIQYSFNDNITAGAAYQYMNGGDADIDVERGPLAGRLQGDYKSFDVHFFALNLSWRL